MHPRFLEIMFIGQYILKVVSRCNLNCSYCYVYNREDQSWRDQPAFMSKDTMRVAFGRIVEHARAQEKGEVLLILHGGEPLLGGVPILQAFADEVRSVFVGTGLTVHAAIQSNGLLYTEEIGEFLEANNISMGVSVDGPPRMNDRYRVDHAGRGSSHALQEKLSRMRGRCFFNGFLVVIDVDNDPVEIFDYLRQFDPPGIDILLPDDNLDRRPKGKPTLLKRATPYGDWMIRLFDHLWRRGEARTRIRFFDSIINGLLGRGSVVESTGNVAAGIVVVEADGSIGASDALKSAFQGATNTGLNVFEHSFDDAARHPKIAPHQGGTKVLCEACTGCELVTVCGGGYLPHRYSSAQGFDNPSVYCADLEKLIRHVGAVVYEHLREVQAEVV